MCDVDIDYCFDLGKCRDSNLHENENIESPKVRIISSTLARFQTSPGVFIR